MSFDISAIKDAYLRLKSYIYYDNTDLLLRRQLVEFETESSKDESSIFRRHPIGYPEIQIDGSLTISEFVDLKLLKIAESLNNYHQDDVFFKDRLSEIEMRFYPKQFREEKVSANFITNRRKRDSYELERVTAFVYAPIELHILSVLWLATDGVKLDSKLGEYCLGNRLLLNKDKTKLVQGSGLFKPYFKQYQKWRDESVSTAQELLKKQKDVLFLNLDVRDYFHSVRIPNDVITNKKRYAAKVFQSETNLNSIILSLHHQYTEQVSEKYQVPGNFSAELKRDNHGLKEFVLPIGLLSSYVLANHYLADFDKKIVNYFRPAYYSRYVDDILVVIADPNPYAAEDTDEDFKFSFANYKLEVDGLAKKKADKSFKMNFKEDSLGELEQYVLRNFSPLITLVDSPFGGTPAEENGRVFKLLGYRSLFCQSEKSLLYYFDPNESDLVIDKLKKELEEKTSEFRDLPDQNDSLNDFEASAYHLQYSGNEGKIRTLKDYKEDRYGLTVYLSNQIFSALRHERRISDEEKDQILKFFKGENCLKFFRLWERILTFLLVNNQPAAYVDFYFECLDQINRIYKRSESNVGLTKVPYNEVQITLIEYLDVAHEISIALDPKFIGRAKGVEQHFIFKVTELVANSPLYIFDDIRLTLSDSSWVGRFRKTNMIRHQYVIIPLLNYTKRFRTGVKSLVGLNVDLGDFELDPELVSGSPRPIKFWECCLAAAFEEFAGFKKSLPDNERDNENYLRTNMLGFNFFRDDEGELLDEQLYLDRAYHIYLQGNVNHLADYVRTDKKHRDKFFEITNRAREPYEGAGLKEFRVNADGKRSLKNPVIAFANTEVTEPNIVTGMRGKPNLSIERYGKLASILRKARSEKSDILLFPEFFIPIQLLSTMVRYAEKNQTMIISGLEHLTVDDTAFNFVVTILPIEVDGIKDATVVLRLKNHYAHLEEHLIHGNHYIVPKPKQYRYDIINWRNLYFSVFYCFELANVEHRSLLKAKVDLLVGIEWNKDTPYFSNIVETCARDLHCFIAQVNTSQFGDTRLTQPVETARKDILKLKGGKNDTILTAVIELDSLREFQRLTYDMTHVSKKFKPLPPDYLTELVLKRIDNKDILRKR